MLMAYKEVTSGKPSTLSLAIPPLVLYHWPFPQTSWAAAAAIDMNLQVTIEGDSSAVKSYLSAVDKELSVKDANVQSLLKEGSRDTAERGDIRWGLHACFNTLTSWLLGESDDSPRRKVSLLLSRSRALWSLGHGAGCHVDSQSVRPTPFGVGHLD
jgi:hypothetical protein